MYKIDVPLNELLKIRMVCIKKFQQLMWRDGFRREYIMTEPIDSKMLRLLHESHRVILRGFIFASFTSFFLNFATLVSSIFMIQVYERVIPARSYETLY